MLIKYNDVRCVIVPIHVSRPYLKPGYIYMYYTSYAYATNYLCMRTMSRPKYLSLISHLNPFGRDRAQITLPFVRLGRVARSLKPWQSHKSTGSSPSSTFPTNTNTHTTRRQHTQPTQPSFPPPTHTHTRTLANGSRRTHAAARTHPTEILSQIR